MKTLLVCLMLLACAPIANGEVVFEQDFKANPDLTAWTVINGSPETVTVSVSAPDGLSVRIEEDTQGWRGVMSNDVFSLPLGGMLIFDYYGTNHDSASAPGLNAHFSSMYWLVSRYDATGLDDYPFWERYVAVKGMDAYRGDWARWYGFGAATDVEVLGDGTATWAEFKHIIITIDAAEVNFYIEDDFYENVENPEPVKTLTTTDYFTVGGLTDGVHAYILNGSATTWFEDPTTNIWDGIKVTIMDPLDPSNCYESIAMGYGLDSDLTGDCIVNLADFALVANDWMKCMDPVTPGCEKPWY